MDRINEISLEGVLPEVFEGDAPTPSDVWRCHRVFRRGEFVTVAAGSGTGKTSMCSFIYGVRRDYVGRISFDSHDISAFGIGAWQELRRRHIAYLPQEMALFPELTAMENICLKNDLTGFVDKTRILQWLDMLGIADKADCPAGRMSVGQQQRVGVIRALCQPFDFLILDEPVSHLDAVNNRAVADMVMAQARSMEAGVIATSVGNHLLLDSGITIYL